MHFPVSIAEPPPTAIITSPEKALNALLPSIASSNLGFTEKPENFSTVIPISSSISAKSLPIGSLKKEFPATRKILFHALRRIESFSSLFTSSLPRTICASINSFLITTIFSFKAFSLSPYRPLSRATIKISR